ncbi:glycoside hydrolase family 3 N-terminal domain-containing protein [Agromyces sp. Leaf222]|uniref:glycoside hydrolase family 3 N-terminal domain-containing protein n=1 Tax=Agromyces sp. Leaf222 TaxID=1735688 RepID=UPI0007015273|nr:glycoside hydrolase family 3 N-terminal domain-containing protein [Agromyces sp. Leaf222]KQM83432.1 glycosyl hydrolase family 3 [Agromyces sp. Leaf222]
MRTRLLLGTAAVLAISLLSGCSGAAPVAAPKPSASPSATPTPTPVDPVAAFVESRMAQMSVEQKAASLLMLHAPGVDPAPLRAYLEQGASGLILMGDNVPANPEELRALVGGAQVDAELPALVAIDEEGGDVQRLPWDAAPGAETLRAEPPAATTDAFSARAATLAASGLNVNFGIVADVTADPDSFIASRVLGTDPIAAGERVAAAVTGEQGTVFSTLKHFPGHGAAPGDSHSSVPSAPLTIDEWRAGPAIPFQDGIDAGAELVMTGHLAYPAVDALPASLSPEWHRILRDELGFDGVVVTDDMLMLGDNGLPEYADPNENAVRAVASGADLLLYVLPADPADAGISVDGLVGAIAAAVSSGRIPQARLDDAVERVLTLRRDLVEKVS